MMSKLDTVTWSWEPSPLTPGRSDLIVNVPAIGSYYSGSYGREADGIRGEVLGLGALYMSAPDEAAFRRAAEADLKKTLAYFAEQGGLDPAAVKKRVDLWKKWKKHAALVREHEALLRSRPHPFEWQARKGLTLYDYVTYTLTQGAPSAWKRAVDTVKEATASS